MWFVYVLQSQRDGRFYCGVTTDPHRRLRQHNGELFGGARSTRRGRPWALVCHTASNGRREALRTEANFKSLRRPAKLRIIARIRRIHRALFGTNKGLAKAVARK